MQLGIAPHGIAAAPSDPDSFAGHPRLGEVLESPLCDDSAVGKTMICRGLLCRPDPKGAADGLGWWPQ